MRKPGLIALAVAMLGLAFAEQATIQHRAAPIGRFPCYLSEKDLYDSEAKFGFDLEIVDSKTYRVIINEQRFESKFRTSAYGTNFNEMSLLFKSGGMMELLEVDGRSLVFIGLYGVTHNQLPFVFLRMRERPKVWIRCGKGNPLDGVRRQEASPNNSSNNDTLVQKLKLPAGSKVGGPLVVGRYACVARRSQRWPDQKDRPFTLGLYSNYEYYIDKPDDFELADDGDFEYNAQNGKLDISMLKDMSNGYDRVSVFYRDANNKPIIAARDDFPTRCQYLGKNTEANLNDKPRYRFSTAPGKGIQLGQIEGIAHSYENQWTYSGLQAVERIYLLLKDGSVMENPPVPPNEIDLTASKRNDAKSWGRWKRQAPLLFVKMPEDKDWQRTKATMTLSAQPNDRLEGEYSTGSSYSLGGGNFGGTTYFWYYTFKKDSTYTRETSSISTTGTAQSNNGFFSSSTGYSGPSGSSSSSGFTSTGSISQSAGASPDVVGSSSGQKNDGANFFGTYSVNGYTLTLKTKSGKVRRALFFFWDKKRDYINIGDSSYSIKK